MKGLVKLLALVIVPVVLVYVGLKSYVYLQTRSALENLRDQIALFVKLEHGSIDSALWSGTILVNDVKLRATGIDDVVKIERMSFSVGDLRHLLQSVGNAKEKVPPESMSIAFHNMSLSLNGELVGTAERLINAAGESNRMRVAHCGGQSTGDFAFLRRLGYDTLALDVAMNYSFNTPAQSMKYDMDMTVRDMTRVVMDARVIGIGTKLSETAEVPRLREFGLRIKDLSYNERMKNYCARAAKITNEEYVTAEIDNGVLRQAGIVLGPGLREAYREYLTKGNGEMQLRIRPTEDLDPRSLALFKPDDLLGMLNLTVDINGKSVSDLSFSTAPSASLPSVAEAAAQPPVAGAARAPITPGASATARAPEAPPVSSFRAVPITELSRYVSHQVRVQESGQPWREGVLLQVEGGIVVIERRYDSGSMSLKIPLPRIARAEVLF